MYEPGEVGPVPDSQPRMRERIDEPSGPVVEEVFVGAVGVSGPVEVTEGDTVARARDTRA